MDYEKLIVNLVDSAVESPFVEFKLNKTDPEMIGKDISALSNSATMGGASEAYMVWGVRDDDRSIEGTTFDPLTQKVGNEDLHNWLRHNLTDNVDYSFEVVEVGDRRTVLLVISAAVRSPARFQNVAYIRDGSHTKPLSKVPQLERGLWKVLDAFEFESSVVMADVESERLAELLDTESVIGMLHQQRPTDVGRMVEILVENGLAVRQPDGDYGITALGAILFAKRITDFAPLRTKTVRIVQYAGPDKMRIVRQHECTGGYAVQFDRMIDTVSMLIPAEQTIVPDGRMVQTYAYPMDAVREVVANALIHQDLTDPMHVIIEIMQGHMTVTNPGRMLIDPDRVLDSPPRSRNTRLPEMFRRMGLCEQLGSGWDRIVGLCEDGNLPTPRAELFEHSTVVSMFERVPYDEMPPGDRIWACYMHTCRMHIQGREMTNRSLRQRFDLEGRNATVSVSRLIKATRDRGLIKSSDGGTGPRNQGYIPYWA